MNYKESFISNPIEQCDLTLTRAIDIYCEREWYLHPLNGKIPLLKDWQNKASIDPIVVKKWFKQWPKANLGIVTGERSNLLVLDIDGEEGKNSIIGLELPETLNVVTARGNHYYFTLPETLKFVSTTRAGLLSGVDTRGRGGFIVAPPSIHPSGHEYHWIHSDSVVANAPEWLVQSLIPSKRSVSKISVSLKEKNSRYARSALRSEFDAVAMAPVGMRNMRLNQAAFSMGTLIPGVLDIEFVAEALARAAFNSGLSDGEIKKTLLSGLSAGMRHPREVSHG